MYFFVMRVLSNTQGKEGYPQGYSTAWVNCWINDSSRENALKKAITLIREHGWFVAEILEAYPISREAYAHNPESLKYYEQALIDGEVFVFYVSKERMDPQQN